MVSFLVGWSHNIKSGSYICIARLLPLHVSFSITMKLVSKPNRGSQCHVGDNVVVASIWAAIYTRCQHCVAMATIFIETTGTH